MEMGMTHLVVSGLRWSTILDQFRAGGNQLPAFTAVMPIINQRLKFVNKF